MGAAGNKKPKKHRGKSAPAYQQKSEVDEHNDFKKKK